MKRDLIIKLATHKKYSRRVSDAGTRLLFKFKSGTHGDFGRHRDREGKFEYTLDGAECESVVHILWECSAYSSSMVALEELLGDWYADFEWCREDILCIRE